MTKQSTTYPFIAFLEDAVECSNQSGPTPLGHIADELLELARAAEQIVVQYRSMPDGELGKGLTNGHILRLERILVKDVEDDWGGVE